MQLRPRGRSGPQAAPFAPGGNVFGRAPAQRDRVRIATQAGQEIGGRKSLWRAWTRQIVHDSLRPRQADRIDLCQRHDDDPDAPLRVHEGRVRAPSAGATSVQPLGDRMGAATLVRDAAALARLHVGSAA